MHLIYAFVSKIKVLEILNFFHVPEINVTFSVGDNILTMLLWTKTLQTCQIS